MADHAGDDDDDDDDDDDHVLSWQPTQVVNARFSISLLVRCLMEGSEPYFGRFHKNYFLSDGPSSLFGNNSYEILSHNLNSFAMIIFIIMIVIISAGQGDRSMGAIARHDYT